MSIPRNAFRIFSNIFTTEAASEERLNVDRSKPIFSREVELPDLMRALITVHDACDEEGRKKLSVLMQEQVQRTRRIPE